MHAEPYWNLGQKEKCGSKLINKVFRSFFFACLSFSKENDCA